MSDIFISYARSTEAQAKQIAEALRVLGYGVWRDDELPAHRAYGEVIEERLRAAKAVVVVWSADAAKSQWVRAEADLAREAGTLVQLTIDGTIPPLPFNQIQCADMTAWPGDLDAPGWLKVAASVAELAGAAGSTPPLAADAPLSLPTKPSIAVLPFANLSGDPEQDYFADGMVVEITNALSRFTGLFVIASGSGLALKGTATSPMAAARRLGVRYALEGSVRKAASRVRVSVQLIDALDGAQIWAHRFEDTLEDVFALQDNVALAVAGVIEPMVREVEVRRAIARPTDNVGSYDLYLRAVALHRTVTKSTVLSAVDLLDRAIALDPAFGHALSLAAHCHYFLFTNAWADDLEACRRRGIELASRALNVAGDDAVVLSRVASVIAALKGDRRGALGMLDRAIELNPGSSGVWTLSGIERLCGGETEPGLDQLARAMRLDPIGPFRRIQLIFMAVGRFQQERFDDAVRLIGAADQGGDHVLGNAVLAACHGHLGNLDERSDALARYRNLAEQPIEEMFERTFFDPDNKKLLLDGITMAKAKNPDGAAAA